MVRTASRPLACLLLALTCAIAFPACHRDKPEDRIRAVVLSVQKGAEERDLNTVLSAVSRRYRDEQGNDREALKGLLLYYFLQHQHIKVLMTGLDISVTGPSATARFQTVLAGREEGGVVPDALDAYRFEVTFTEESGSWRIVAARWTPLTRTP